jgi:hypothetical protein
MTAHTIFNKCSNLSKKKYIINLYRLLKFDIQYNNDLSKTYSNKTYSDKIDDVWINLNKIDDDWIDSNKLLILAGKLYDKEKLKNKYVYINIYNNYYKIKDCDKLKKYDLLTQLYNQIYTTDFTDFNELYEHDLHNGFKIMTNNYNNSSNIQLPEGGFYNIHTYLDYMFETLENYCRSLGEIELKGGLPPLTNNGCCKNSNMCKYICIALLVLIVIIVVIIIFVKSSSVETSTFKLFRH